MTPRTLLAPLAVLGAMLSSGCAMHGSHGHAGMAGSAPAGAAHGRMQRMCEMHRGMAAGRSAAEQQEALEAHIRSRHGSVSPERLAHHRQMVERHCGAAKAPANPS